MAQATHSANRQVHQHRFACRHAGANPAVGSIPGDLAPAIPAPSISRQSTIFNRYVSAPRAPRDHGGGFLREIPVGALIVIIFRYRPPCGGRRAGHIAGSVSHLCDGRINPGLPQAPAIGIRRRTVTIELMRRQGAERIGIVTLAVVDRFVRDVFDGSGRAIAVIVDGAGRRLAGEDGECNRRQGAPCQGTGESMCASRVFPPGSVDLVVRGIALPGSDGI